jgi:hypothetical protein
MLIEARQWIRETFVPGSRPTLKQVEKWIDHGNIVGRWERGTLMVDPQSLRSDSEIDRRPVPKIIPHPLLGPKPTGWVYLVYSPDLRRLKIGWTTNPDQRLMQLQGQSPARLVLLKAIQATEPVERKLLHAFRSKRLHGEWFEDCPEIRAEFGVP